MFEWTKLSKRKHRKNEERHERHFNQRRIYRAGFDRQGSAFRSDPCGTDALDGLRLARSCSAMVEKEKECDGFLLKIRGLT